MFEQVRGEILCKESIPNLEECYAQIRRKTTVDVLTPKVFIGLIMGAMLPYWFSAMTMKSVGSTALKEKKRDI